MHTLSEQRPAGLFAHPSQHAHTESWRTRRERIAQLARGEALVMIGSRWELVPTLPYDQYPTFAPSPRHPVLSVGVGTELVDAGRLQEQR